MYHDIVIYLASGWCDKCDNNHLIVLEEILWESFSASVDQAMGVLSNQNDFYETVCQSLAFVASGHACLGFYESIIHQCPNLFFCYVMIINVLCKLSVTVTAPLISCITSYCIEQEIYRKLTNFL